MNGALNGIISVMVAIVGVAALAVIFSRNADTARVISASGDAFAKSLEAAAAPIIGTNRVGLGYP